VDGQDFGSGTMNIYIFPTGSWRDAIEVVTAYLKSRKVLDQAIIAKRPKASHRCKVVWPPDFDGEFSEIG
jgi:hypothetical protein